MSKHFSHFEQDVFVKHKDGQDHKDKNLDTSRKILSQEMLMCNTKALALTVQKLLARLMFSKIGQTPRSRSQGKK